ncbi:MAG: hypothetical protein AB1646_17730 [Thermodesulfobacteriota bacterium]
MKKRFLVLSLLVVSASLVSGPVAAEVYWDTDAQFEPEITSSDFNLKFKPAPEAKSYTKDEIYDSGERPAIDEDDAEEPIYNPSSAPTGESLRRAPAEPSRVRSEPPRTPRQPRNVTREPQETPREPVSTSRPRLGGPTTEPAAPLRAPTAGPTQGAERPTGTPVPAIGDEPPTTQPKRWGAVQQGADVKPAEPRPRFQWGQQN